jgi:creatinine amidohydrolase
MQAYTNSGVIGYPSRDIAEKGKKVINHLGQAAQSLTTLLISQST